MEADGTFVREFDLPGQDQEGVTLAPSCNEAEASVFISQDSGAVWSYGAYPVVCVAPEIAALGRLGGGAPMALLLFTGIAIPTLRMRSARPLDSGVKSAT